MIVRPLSQPLDELPVKSAYVLLTELTKKHDKTMFIAKTKSCVVSCSLPQMMLSFTPMNGKVTPTSIGFMQRFATAKGNGLWLSELKNLLSGMTMTMESAKFTTILPKACGQR